MDTIFTRGPSILHRLFLTLLLSDALIVVDHKLDGFSKVRVYLNSLVSPLQYIANLPGEMLSWSADRVANQQLLIEENTRLTRQAIELAEQLQRVELLQQENDRLRQLLGSPVRGQMRKMVAELLAVDNNPYSHQIVINKGTTDGVFEGQSVLDENGIVGQVYQVGTTTSRVLLIADVTHAVPVRVSRNNIGLVANGTGQLTELTLPHVAHSADVKVGDILLSSGLGKVFPEGYPTAKITQVIRDEGRPFALVKAQPIAQLDRLKYVLLLWSNEQDLAGNG